MGGGQCADTYFQELNITGAWVKSRQSSGLSLVDAEQTGGLYISAQGVRDEHPDWMKFGKVALKVVHGRTQQGLSYLNFYVKNLALWACCRRAARRGRSHRGSDTF